MIILHHPILHIILASDDCLTLFLASHIEYLITPFLLIVRSSTCVLAYQCSTAWYMLSVQGIVPRIKYLVAVHRRNKDLKSFKDPRLW